MQHLLFTLMEIQKHNLGRIGEDLFIGTLPADVPVCTALIDPLTGHEVDEGMGRCYDGTFQCITRHTDESVARQRAEALFEMMFMSHREDTSVHIVKMTPRTRPIVYPRSEADEVEVSFLVDVNYCLK